MKYYEVLPFVVARIERNGKVLIGQQPNLKRQPYPGWWNLPGGKLEENETPEEGIKREIKEELGLRVVSLKLVGVYHHSGKRIKKECTSKIPGLGICYKAKVKGKMLPTEQGNVHYAALKELKTLRLTPWTKYFLKDLWWQVL